MKKIKNIKEFIKLYKIIISVLAIFIVVLVLSNLVIIYKYNNLKEDLTQLNEEKNNLEIKINYLEGENKDLNKTKTDLEEIILKKDQNYNKLIEKYQIIKNDKKNISNDYTNLEMDYNYLIEDLNSFRNDIKESMSWFKLNSDINYLDKNLKHKVNVALNDCVICDNKECKVKLACIELKNNKVLKLDYSLDKEITNKEDRLQSLESFLDNKKGDCEDFALLFAAELRHIFNNLIEEDKKILLEPIIYTDTKRNYYLDEDEEWYYDSGVEGIVYKDYNKVYVGCGQAYDPQSKNINGHCFIVISRDEINNILDLNDINAIAIEPQSGGFIGEVNKSINIKNKEYSIYLIDKIDPNLNLKNIYMLISKDNLIYNNKYFNYEDDNWKSYNLFLEKINKIR